MMQQALNAVIYARYSSHNQTEQSIEGQLRDCYAFAEREGLQVIGEYIDRAITGRTDERPDFQRMIADARKQEFQRVIVWKFDRFSRDRYDSAIYKHKLKQCGVRVLSAMENVGEGDVSIILEALLEASAEQYSLDLSKKVLRGQRESRLKGTFLGGLTPIGYKLENTLTENGHVARGVCVTDEEGHLLKINERTHIEKHDGGTAYTEDDGKTWTMLPEGSTVSMNMWGFSASILKELKDRFPKFLDENLKVNPLKCEYFLPFVVDELLGEKRATVKVLKSMDKWYGVTYKEDKPVVVAAIQNLKDGGLYPQRLWEE